MKIGQNFSVFWLMSLESVENHMRP